jgi:predicted permease
VRGESLGRRTLYLDAAYCAGGGLVAIAAAGPLASVFGVPTALVALLGAAAIAWAGLLLVLARGPRWRRSVALVAAANVAATCGFLALAVLLPRVAAQVLLAAVAVEVLVFAGVQAAAVRRG